MFANRSRTRSAWAFAAAAGFAVSMAGVALAQDAQAPNTPPTTAESGVVASAQQPIEITTANTTPAVITAVKGKVQYRTGPDKPWEAAKPQQMVRQGVEFRTAAQSTVQLLIGATQIITVDQIAYAKFVQVQNVEGKETTRIEVPYGRVIFDVDSTKTANDVQIKAPDATLAVKGTKGYIQTAQGFATRAGGARDNTGRIEVTFGKTNVTSTMTRAEHTDARTTSPAANKEQSTFVDTTNTKAREDAETKVAQRATGGGDAVAVAVGTEEVTKDNSGTRADIAPPVKGPVDPGNNPGPDPNPDPDPEPEPNPGPGTGTKRPIYGVIFEPRNSSGATVTKTTPEPEPEPTPSNYFGFNPTSGHFVSGTVETARADLGTVTINTNQWLNTSLATIDRGGGDQALILGGTTSNGAGVYTTNIFSVDPAGETVTHLGALSSLTAGLRVDGFAGIGEQLYATGPGTNSTLHGQRIIAIDLDNLQAPVDRRMVLPSFQFAGGMAGASDRGAIMAFGTSGDATGHPDLIQVDPRNNYMTAAWSAGNGDFTAGVNTRFGSGVNVDLSTLHVENIAYVDGKVVYDAIGTDSSGKPERVTVVYDPSASARADSRVLSVDRRAAADVVAALSGPSSSNVPPPVQLSIRNGPIDSRIQPTFANMAYGPDALRTDTLQKLVASEIVRTARDPGGCLASTELHTQLGPKLVSNINVAQGVGHTVADFRATLPQGHPCAQ